MNMKRIIALLLASICIKAMFGQYIQPNVWNIAVDTAAIAKTDTIPFASDYTIIGVGRVNNAADTLAYWRLNVTDSTFAEMTNHGIKTEAVIPHNTFSIDVEHNHIILLSQSYEDEVHDSLSRLQSGVGARMVEYACFGKRLDTEEALRFQTYLAIKYGITLDYSNYLAGDSLIWNAVSDELFYHRVIGVGCDSIYGLRSNISVQSANEPTIVLKADTLLQGEYVLAGDNDLPLTLSSFDTIPNVLMRHWRIRNHGIDSITIEVAPAKFGCVNEDFKMIRIHNDSYSLIEPLTMDSTASFRINQLTGNEEITFIGRNPRNNMRSQNEHNTSQPTDGELALTVYPNPSTGTFNVDVQLPEVIDAELKVTTASGQILISETLSGSQAYSRTYETGVPQIYYVEVKSGDASKIVKLIVY